MLRPAHQTVVHECVVDRVTRDCVVLRMSHTAKEGEGRSIDTPDC